MTSRRTSLRMLSLLAVVALAGAAYSGSQGPYSFVACLANGGEQVVSDIATAAFTMGQTSGCLERVGPVPEIGLPDLLGPGLGSLIRRGRLILLIWLCGQSEDSC